MKGNEANRAILLSLFVLLCLCLLVGCERAKTDDPATADTTPPVLLGVRDRSVLLGEGAVLLDGVTAQDDRPGEVSLTVDTSTLDVTKEGFYYVTYIATDAAGNQTRRMAYVTVYAEQISEQMLMSACDEYLEGLISHGDTKEVICRLVYQAVQHTVEYVPISDKTDWVRAAYDALFGKRRGDCFSYFSAAKALLTQASIQTLDVERTHGEGEETHFWLMVNLAEPGESARWYHFDPTKLDTGGFEHDGCLFTDAELDAYNAYREGFYSYDRAAYPATATESLR